MKYTMSIWFFMFMTWVPLHAYIYEIKVMRKWHDQLNRYHYFIGLSDFHDKRNAANVTQMKDLTKIFTACCQQHPKIVIEDVSSVGANGRMSCGNYYVDSKGGILGGLANVCTSCGLHDVQNIEYRYCRVTSLGPIVNNINADPMTMPSSKNIKVSCLLGEIDAMAGEVKKFESKGAMQNYYTDVVNEVQQKLDELQLRTYHNSSVAEYVEKFEATSGRAELIRHLLTFDSKLLDVKLLHTIVSATDTSTIIGIAGGAHIGRTCEQLEKAGYEEIHGNKITFFKEYDPEKCIGCVMIDGRYCLKPNPIDISILSQFM